MGINSLIVAAINILFYCSHEYAMGCCGTEGIGNLSGHTTIIVNISTSVLEPFMLAVQLDTQSLKVVPFKFLREYFSVFRVSFLEVMLETSL